MNGQKLKYWLDISAGADSPLVNPTNISRNTVYSEADLVNLRQGDAALYQTQADAVSYPNNGRAVGSISPEIARTLRLDKPGAIVLDDIGLQHIEDRHGGQIRERGFDSVASFVDYVLRKFDALYEGNQNNSYELVCREQEPFKKVTVKLQFERVGEFYRISNAQFIRAGSYKKRSPLWEKAPTSHSETEPYRAYRGQSGEQLWERAQSNHSPKGTPDAISGQSGMRQDAVDNISLGIGNREVNGAPRARVAFDAAEGGRAVIESFSAADASSAPQADMPPLEEMRAMMAAAEQGLDRALNELGARQTVSCDVRAGEGDAGLAFICRKLFYECLNL